MIEVWTRQHLDVLKELNTVGRHWGRREFIETGMPEYRDFTIVCTEWLIRNCPLPPAEGVPDDAFPVWVQTNPEATYFAGDDGVVLKLLVDEKLICGVNVAKWGIIQNFGYIPLDEADRIRHVHQLRDLGISDIKAFTTPFYPEVKAEIVSSWPRLFDKSVKSDSELEYGIMREIRREWIVSED